MKKLIFTLLCMLPILSFANPVWETFKTPDGEIQLARLSTPHGWLVAYKDLARGTTFIPDENKEWKIDSTIVDDTTNASNDHYLKKSDLFFIIFISVFITFGLTMLTTLLFSKS